MTDQRCGTCVHWNARLNKRGVRITAGDRHYGCAAPLPDLPALPAAVEMGGWGGLHWPPHRRSMGKNEGRACQSWEDWKEPRAADQKGGE